jgi:hypothetical protein
LKTPTKAEVREALNLVLDSNTAWQFYHGLKNPNWVELLNDEGVFKNLPPIQKGSTEGSLVYSIWPQSKYLANVAEGNPRGVFNVVINMDKSNHYILKDIVDAASKMPAELCGPLAKNIEGYLRKRLWFDGLLCTSLVTLTRTLIEAGNVEGANSLAASLLMVQPSRTGQVIELDGHKHRPDPDGKMDDWDYNRALKALLEIWTEHNDLGAVKVLATLLDSAIYIKEGGPKSNSVDGSIIWLRDFKASEKSYENNVHQALARGLRELSANLIRKDPHYIDPIISEIEIRRSKWMIFRRILLSLGEDLADVNLATLVNLIQRSEDLNEIGVYPEYWGTLSVTFAKLPSDVQQWVLAELKASPIDKGENEKDRQAWIFRRLCFIDKFLTGADLAYFKDLETKFPRPKLELVSSSVSYVGHKSPKNTEELLSMPAEELLTFLKAWRVEEGDPFGPSEEGLKRSLEEAVAKRAPEFALLAPSFTNLAPTYFRGLVCGLSKALKEGVTFSWGALLDAAEIVAPKPANEKVDRGYSRYESDPGWDWAKGEMANLLQELIEKNKDILSDDEKSRIVRVLQMILDMDYPEEEESIAKENEILKAFEKSINSVKGKAMNALIELMKSGSEITEQKEWHKLAFLLFENSIAGEGIYQPLYAASWAINFNSFYNQHLAWFKVAIRQILDASETKRKAAFYTFVVWSLPHSKTFDLFRTYYEKATQEEVEEEVADKLGEHLARLYWSGAFDSPPEDILFRFWNSAEEGPRQHMIWFVGRALIDTVDGPVPIDILRRLESLGRKILALQGKAAPSIKAKASFGYWIASNKFSMDWVLECLELIQIDPIAYFDDLEGVLSTLGQFSELPIERISNFVEGYFTATRPIEDLILCKEALLQIMLRCMAGATPSQLAKLKTAANHLGKRGFSEFKKVALG